MLFLSLLSHLLFLVGPIVGWYAAMRRLLIRRWQLIALSTAGGAMAAVLLLGSLLLAELWWPSTARALLRPALPVIGVYAAFGLVLGFIGVVTRTESTRRLFVIGLVIVGPLAVIRLTKVAAAARPYNEGFSGIVVGPGNVQRAGVPVFLDRGIGTVERLTTDTAGRFHAPLEPRGFQPALLLICMPGGVPKVDWPVENLPTVYWIVARPRRVRVHSHIQELGWRGPIPPECQGDSAKH